VTVLIENVRHHIDEEEGDLFPKVRDALGRKALQELGDAMANVRESAPTHPHPRAPDEPPANAVTSVVAGAVDRVGDNLSGLAQGGVSVVQDLIARLLDLRRPATRPTGSSTARSTARKVRTTGTAAADKVAQAGTAASAATKRAARKASASTTSRPRRKPTPAKRAAKTA
jgi:hypothetical protein